MNLVELIPQHSLVVPIAVFGFLSCLWILALTFSSQWFGDGRGVSARDRTLRIWVDGKETSVVLPAQTMVNRSGFDGLLQQAGVRVSRRAFVSQSVMLLGISFVITLIWSKSFIIGVGVIALLGTLIYSLLKMRSARRHDLIARQSIEALRLANRSLKAGRSVSDIMEFLAEHTDSPTRDLFLEIVQREKMGEPVSDAIYSVLPRFESTELRAFCTALVLQIEVGGSLVETLDRLTTSIIERMTLRKRGLALTASPRLSTKIMLVVPFLLIAILSIFSDGYSTFMFQDPIGRLLLVGAFLLLLCGYLVVSRITTRGVDMKGAFN
jgi:tight adherence protein B